MEENKYLGQVIWFNNQSGYGFIKWDQNGTAQQDLFVHFSDITCEGFKTIKKDQQVSFGVGQNNKGQPKAINVLVVN